MRYVASAAKTQTASNWSAVSGSTVNSAWAATMITMTMAPRAVTG